MSKNVETGVRVALKSNYLLENKRLLVAQEIGSVQNDKKQQLVSPERLHTILTLGHGGILRGIDDFHQKQRERNPNTTMTPWLNVVQLCLPGEEPNILSKIGLEEPYKELSQTEHMDISDLQMSYHPYWQAVDGGNLLVRVQSHLKGWPMHDGAWLQVHTPENQQ